MKLQTLKEAKYTSSSKSLKTLLQFFVEDDSVYNENENDKVFYVHEKFLARLPTAQGGTEIVRLEFLAESPDNVIIMYSDGESEGMPIQQALKELVIYRCEKVY